MIPPALLELQKRIAEAAGGVLRRAVYAVAAEVAEKQLAAEFSESRGPDGAPWAPLKYRHGQPLDLTGKMKKDFRVAPTEKGIRVSSPTPYTLFHQYGTKGHKAHQREQAINRKGRFSKKSKKTRTLSFKAGGGAIPARPMVPEGGLTPRWSEAIRTEADRVFRLFWRQ